MGRGWTPNFMAEVVAELSQLAQKSPHLNQRSGVSVRLTIANYETLVANATRRALRNGESEAVPRVSDLQALVPPPRGRSRSSRWRKGERRSCCPNWSRPRSCWSSAGGWCSRSPGVIGAFSTDTVVHAGDDLPATAYATTLGQMPALSAPVLALTGGSEDPGVVASAVEFLLEGLHLTKRLNKEAARGRATYRGRG